MVEHEPSKLVAWVRFPSPAPSYFAQSFSALSFVGIGPTKHRVVYKLIAK